VISGRRVVLVDEPAEDRATPDPAVDRLGAGRVRARRMQLQRSMSGHIVPSAKPLPFDYFPTAPSRSFMTSDGATSLAD
jgi:hypothetical protein